MLTEAKAFVHQRDIFVRNTIAMQSLKYLDKALLTSRITMISMNDNPHITEFNCHGI